MPVSQPIPEPLQQSVQHPLQQLLPPPLIGPQPPSRPPVKKNTQQDLAALLSKYDSSYKRKDGGNSKQTPLAYMNRKHSLNTKQKTFGEADDYGSTS